MALFHLVDLCNYGNLRDEMLRDRLVVGIRDDGLSQRLQMDSELTLAKAMKLVRQSEAVKQHTRQLQDHPNTHTSVDLATMHRRPTPQYEKSAHFHKLLVRLTLKVGNFAPDVAKLPISREHNALLVH